MFRSPKIIVCVGLALLLGSIFPIGNKVYARGRVSPKVCDWNQPQPLKISNGGFGQPSKANGLPRTKPIQGHYRPSTGKYVPPYYRSK